MNDKEFGAKVAAILRRARRPTKWKRIEPPTCDTCDRRAVYEHPAGGLRCRTCPRPEY